MENAENSRWSDSELEKFHAEFRQHLEDEKREKIQQSELHAAIFQKEDKDANVPAGILQQLARGADQMEKISGQIGEMVGRDARRKTFVAGGIFVAGAVWFLLTEGVHRFVTFLSKL